MEEEWLREEGKDVYCPYDRKSGKIFVGKKIR